MKEIVHNAVLRCLDASNLERVQKVYWEMIEAGELCFFLSLSRYFRFALTLYFAGQRPVFVTLNCLVRNFGEARQFQGSVISVCNFALLSCVCVCAQSGLDSRSDAKVWLSAFGSDLQHSDWHLCVCQSLDRSMEMTDQHNLQ